MFGWLKTNKKAVVRSKLKYFQTHRAWLTKFDPQFIFKPLNLLYKIILIIKLPRFGYKLVLVFKYFKYESMNGLSDEDHIVK